MTISLDISNLMAEKVGEHGLSAADVAAIDARIPALRERLADERTRGLHGYLNTHDAGAVLETTLQVCQPRMGRFHSLVLLGIGGSSLGLKALVNALEVIGQPQVDLHVVDSTDPSLLGRVIARIDLRDTLFVAVSKSGGTIETVIALGFFAEKLRHAGLELKQHMIAVTDPQKGPLRAFAEKNDLDTCEIPPEVGGRFSVLTAAGLAPAALLHLDIVALNNGALAGENLGQGPVARDWPARLGLLCAELCKRGKGQLVFMPYSSRLQYVSNWFAQLWDESLGKSASLDGKPAVSGQTVIPAVGPADQHAQLQLFLEGPNDKLILFTRIERHVPDITLGDFDWGAFDAKFVKGKTLGQVINAQHAGTADACTQRKRPNMTLNLPVLDAARLGELIMGLEIATTYAGYAFGVNPYDQPSVELGKGISRRMLGG